MQEIESEQLVTYGSVITLTLKLISDSKVIVKEFIENHPLEYLHGIETYLPGLTHALERMKVGESFDINIQPELAYGELDESLDIVTTVSSFPKGFRNSIRPGMMFDGFHQEHCDSAIRYMVVKVDGGSVYATANHPLAGRTINAVGTILNIRLADSLELEHGHAHGPYTHQHQESSIRMFRAPESSLENMFTKN